MADTVSPIENLPSELLASVLGEFNTKELLPIVTVSHRFCSIATQILHQRLVASPSRSNHSVVLECCHPSARISTPYFRCQYVGDAACDGPPINEQDPSFGDLRRIYTCFRPVVVESNRRKRFRYGWSAETMNGDSTQLHIAADDDDDDDDEEAGDTVHQEVYLDEGERFSQLCTAANVVLHGSRPGLFMRHVNMSDGVIRVFRGWLASMLPGRSSSHVESAATEIASISESGLFSSDDSRVLWVDRTKNVGIRFRVTPGPEARGTIWEDEPPVFYNLTYEELVVRASTLLLATDEADVQHAAHSGKDIVFAPFTIL